MIQYAINGVNSLTPDAIESLKGFLLSQLNEDGGVLGRDAKSDLYYTVFGIQLLHVLKLTPGNKSILVPFVVPASAGFVRSFSDDFVKKMSLKLPTTPHKCGTTNDSKSIVMRAEALLSNFLDSFGDGKKLDFIHLASLIRCLVLLQADTGYVCQPVEPIAKVKNGSEKQNPPRAEGVKTQGSACRSHGFAINSIISRIEAFRSLDGGYNHLSKNAESGTVYAAFLAYLAYQASGLSMPASDKLIQSLEHLKMKDGSFANDSEMDSGATTATAAAIMLLKAYRKDIDTSTIDSLLAREAPEGGFMAGLSSPVPDLLSTATALLALKTADYNISELKSPHKEFISSLWNEDGGFSGHIFDDVSDCEYTFYALLALGTM